MRPAPTLMAHSSAPAMPDMRAMAPAVRKLTNVKPARTHVTQTPPVFPRLAVLSVPKSDLVWLNVLIHANVTMDTKATDFPVQKLLQLPQQPLPQQLPLQQLLPQLLRQLLPQLLPQLQPLQPLPLQQLPQQPLPKPLVLILPSMTILAPTT